MVFFSFIDLVFCKDTVISKKIKQFEFYAAVSDRVSGR